MFYVDKFNYLLAKLKYFYNKLEDEDGWIKEEYNHLFNRWQLMNDIKECRFKEIEIRN